MHDDRFLCQAEIFKGEFQIGVIKHKMSRPGYQPGNNCQVCCLYSRYSFPSAVSRARSSTRMRYNKLAVTTTKAVNVPSHVPIAMLKPVYTAIIPVYAGWRIHR